MGLFKCFLYIYIYICIIGLFTLNTTSKIIDLRDFDQCLALMLV